MGHVEDHLDARVDQGRELLLNFGRSLAVQLAVEIHHLYLVDRLHADLHAIAPQEVAAVGTIRTLTRSGSLVAGSLTVNAWASKSE